MHFNGKDIFSSWTITFSFILFSLSVEFINKYMNNLIYVLIWFHDRIKFSNCQFIDFIIRKVFSFKEVPKPTWNLKLQCHIRRLVGQVYIIKCLMLQYILRFHIDIQCLWKHHSLLKKCFQMKKMNLQSDTSTSLNWVWNAVRLSISML